MSLESATIEPAGTDTGQATRLLVVEDDPLVAVDLREILEALGYAVPHVLHRGEDAAQDPEMCAGVDLILMDVRLKGGMDGIEAAAAIRSRIDVPIVFVTAYADPETIDRAKAVAPYGYLVKPFMSRELRSTIELALYKHRMETRLRRSERWLFTTLKSIGDGIIATDRDGRVALMNPEAERLTGHREADARGNPVDQVLRFAGEVIGPHPALAALGKGASVDLAADMDVVSATGERVPVTDRAAPILDENGETVGVVVVFRDDSERRRTEAELRASEERYRVLFEQDVVANVVTNPAGQILACNAAFASLVGVGTPEEAQAHRAEDFYADPRDREDVLKALEDTRVVHARELALKRPDGTRVDVLATSSARRDPDGTVREIHGHMIDITERKRLELQLQQMERLRSIGQLAGGIAHDFNNLLTGILGYVEIAKRELMNRTGDDPSAGRDALTVIGELGERGALLVRQLLAFGRGDTRPMEVTDLLELVRGQASILERVLAEDIELVMDLPDEPRQVRADPGQVQQVLMNLVLNARDAMPHGGRITIRVSDRRLDTADVSHDPRFSPGAYLELAVADTGTGMSPDTLQRVFEPFFSTKPSGQGTGLGLSIVYGIARDHEGLVEVQSVEGEGSEIRVLLPADSTEGAAARPDAEPAPAPSEAPAGGEETILVVDDESSVRTLIDRVLDGLGYRVLSCASGAEALQTLEDPVAPVDLLVTDLGMPTMDGRELLAAARRLRPGLPAVLISGHDLRSGREESDAGATRTLPKPFRPAELARIVREMLDDS